jgi:4-hydroxy-tetrahydrodipicolinate reductase
MHAQLLQCAAAGAHVVSSTEELSYPYDRHPAIARELDTAAKAHGVVILGTGVNPGYAMDTLALTATGVCNEVRAVHVERVVDAGKRREPLQRKVGAGLTAEAFEAKKKTGTFGHIGLRESLLMLADGLGWKLGEIDETLGPMIAGEDFKTPFLQVRKGEVAGIHHAITGSVNGAVVLSLDLKMYVGADAPRDAVRVDGDPPIDLVVRGGIFGDTATVATLINGIPLVLGAAPGLRTMKDVPVPRAFATTLAGYAVLS